MADPRISIDVGLNASGVAKGAKDAEKALTNLESAVQETGSDGARDLNKLEDGLKDVQRQSERTERSVDDIGRSSKKSFDGASDNIRGFKDEAVQNFSEVASSFDGSIQGMTDGVQGLTGGLASALTPGIGIPIAILGAAAGAFLQSWIDSAADSEERVNEAFERMKEAGNKFLSESQVQEAVKALSGEDVQKGIQRSTDLFIDQGAILRAMVGDSEAIASIQRVITDRKREEVDAVRDSGASLEDQATKIDGINTKYAEQLDWLRDIQNDTTTAGAKWDAVKAAVDSTGQAVDQLAGKTVNIPVRLDTTAVEAQFRALQNRNLTVKLTPTLTQTGGRQLLQ